MLDFMEGQPKKTLEKNSKEERTELAEVQLWRAKKALRDECFPPDKYIDTTKSFKGHKIGVHTNDNTATIWLRAEDLLKLIQDHGNKATLRLSDTGNYKGMTVLLRKRFLLMFSVLCVMICSCCGTVSASEGFFQAGGDVSYLYHMDERIATYQQEDGNICFRLQDNGEALLTDADGTQEYMRFSPYDGSKYGVAYSIKPFCLSQSRDVFYEVTASAGAHGQNVGYWIVGEKDGQWVEYVTIDSLAEEGYTAQNWHMLRSYINDGDFILVSTHEYMPPGAEFAYQRQHVKDAEFRLFWDMEAEWFGIERIS